MLILWQWPQSSLRYLHCSQTRVPARFRSLTGRQEIAFADAAFWYQAYTQVSQRELLLERKVKQLEAECDQQLRFVDELNQQIDALKYQLVWMAQQLFGKKTETLKSDTGKPDEPSDTASDQVPIGDNAEQDNGKKRNKGRISNS
jgi:hypothetical protein